MKNLLLGIIYVWGIAYAHLQAQDLPPVFVSHGKIPTYTSVIADWQTTPKVHIYNSSKFQGHAEFVNRGLNRSLKFSQFVECVKKPELRQYLPIFVYDLKKKPITVEGKSYTWAIQLEDYAYTDSPEQLAVVMVKSATLIAKHLGVSPSDILLVIYNEGKNHYNKRELSPILAQKGKSLATVSDLIRHFQGNIIEILNGAECYGKLKYFHSEKDLRAAKFEDIAILSFSPDKLPPLSGIITTIPQTPLSHINLLAKNRGTFNMYILDTSYLPEISQHRGEWVRIYEKNHRVYIEKVGEAKALHEIHLKKPKPLSIPSPSLSVSAPIPLVQEKKALISSHTIGTKATNYAKIYNLLGENYVRPGFALGFHTYYEIINQQANVLIQEMLANKHRYSPVEIGVCLDEIRATIKQARFSQVLEKDLENLIVTQFPHTKIRLRSSTNCEDLPHFNGAGLYTSEGYHPDDPRKKLYKKILKVYASLWTWEAFQERELFGIDHSKVAMGILIHAAFPDEYANGVALGEKSSTGKFLLTVNAQKGDNPIVQPAENTQAESFLSEEGKITKQYSASSIGDIFLGNPVYFPLLQELSSQTEKIYDDFLKQRKEEGDKNRYGIDVEFKITQEKNRFRLWIKQARLLRQDAILPQL